MHFDLGMELYSIPGKGKRVFVGSMCDLFHPAIPDGWRDRIFADILADHIMLKGHGHTFLCLTKRPHVMQLYFKDGKDVLLRRWGKAGDGRIDCLFASAVESLRKDLWPLPNVWLGVTICNQAEADAKIPVLLQVPAARRFVSIEPMLGPVDLNRCERCMYGTGHSNWLDWVICGGETGDRARPLHPNWVRRLRNQCVDSGTPFFFKGWGEWFPRDLVEHMDIDCKRWPCIRLTEQGKEWTRLENSREGEIALVQRVGKRNYSAYRILDRQSWSQFPPPVEQ